MVRAGCQTIGKKHCSIKADADTQTGELDLSELDIEVLPADISTLQHLRLLNCSSTEIDDITLVQNLLNLHGR